MDRATFVDSIVRDAGFDIFEKKLEELKEYKKEIAQDRINLNLEESENKIKELNQKIIQILNDKKELVEKSKEFESSISKLNIQRDINIKQLYKIDDINVYYNDVLLQNIYTKKIIYSYLILNCQI